MTPGRLCQVVGRLARIGQANELVSVQLFFVENTIEHRILQLRPLMGLPDCEVTSDDGTVLHAQRLSWQSYEETQDRKTPEDIAFSLLNINPESTS